MREVWRSYAALLSIVLIVFLVFGLPLILVVNASDHKAKLDAIKTKECQQVVREIAKARDPVATAATRRDPWGGEFAVTLVAGELPQDEFRGAECRSAGADQLLGTADDVVYRYVYVERSEAGRQLGESTHRYFEGFFKGWQGK